MTTIIEEIIKIELGIKTDKITPLSGGSINDAYCVSHANKNWFIKLNSKTKYPGMFELESKGLKLLKNSDFIIPGVISYGEYLDYSYLILDFIDTLSEQQMNWHLFGKNLAKMHQLSNDVFGLDYQNYIGSLEQKNNSAITWEEFYANQRILALSESAFNLGLLSNAGIKSAERLCAKLQDLLPKESPSLLHGDLWQGNLLCNKDSKPVLIDPAVYYGHREMDLAMLFLFGSIPNDSILEYELTYPLEKGWKKRMDIHQLYPLLVHLILFGESYYGSVNSILKKYV